MKYLVLIFFLTFSFSVEAKSIFDSVLEKQLVNNYCAGGPAKKYDSNFKSAAFRNGGQDWCKLKSQCIQESQLKDNAVSRVGAKGLCQFMPNTWKEYNVYKHTNLSPFSAVANINANAWYMYKMRKEWYAPRDETCRWQLALASYNAGLGTVLNAQKKSGGERCFEHMKEFLPKETQIYVYNIQKIYKEISK